MRGFTPPSTLHRYRAKIIGKCVEDAAVAAKRGQIFRYPGWETALGWFHRPKRIQRSGRYWLTPPACIASSKPSFTSTAIPVLTHCRAITTH